MAGELQCDHETGRVVYFLIRNNTAAIWNGITFEGYTPANYSTYDVAAAEQGASGLYAGDMPAAPAGLYGVVAKDRAGLAPAESDKTIGVGQILWNGEAVIGPGDVDGLTYEQALRIVLASASGVLEGAGTAQLRMKSPDGSTDRITAAVDGDGNRLSVALNPD